MRLSNRREEKEEKKRSNGGLSALVVERGLPFLMIRGTEAVGMTFCVRWVSAR